MRRNDPPNKESLGACRALGRLAAPATVLFVLSCGSSGSVAVTATIASPDLVVDASSPLAARLTGSFRLHLELGKHAPAATDVSVGQGNLTLQDATSQASLVLLKFSTTPSAPYHLEPGGKLDVGFMIADKAESSGQLLTKDEEKAVCGARAAAQIAGSISDGGGLVSVNSTSFPIRCP